jgi:heterodisulfide reductase subunit A-like polyferredoxin
MVREVVRVDAALCSGCGECLSSCPHRALELGGRHARLLDEALCEACGACLGPCGGALFLEAREARPFDEAAVERRLEKLERLRALGAEV